MCDSTCLFYHYCILQQTDTVHNGVAWGKKPIGLLIKTEVRLATSGCSPISRGTSMKLEVKLKHFRHYMLKTTTHHVFELFTKCWQLVLAHHGVATASNTVKMNVKLSSTRQRNSQRMVLIYTYIKP